MDTIHSRIREARSYEGLTQRQLAAAVGVQQRQIARYEAGDAIPRERTLIKIAEATNVGLSWLKLGGTFEVRLDKMLSDQDLERVKEAAASRGMSVQEWCQETIYSGLAELESALKAPSK